MKVRYIRLLNYDNACKVIDFINKNGDCKDRANITVGGVSTYVKDVNWDKVVTYLDTLDTRYEIGEEAPYKVVANIVTDLKQKGVIK